MAITAYLGTKHAFDADHITCIDNTIRKLSQQKQNPMGVGFYFSMGHSSVVIVMTIITALALHWAKEHTPMLAQIGGVVGTLVSGFFLLVVGVLNGVILIDLFKVFKHTRHNTHHDQEALEKLLQERRLLNRTITSLGVLVALLIGLIELFQVLSKKLHWELSWFLGYLQHLDFGDLGFYLVGLFVPVWGISFAIWHLSGLEKAAQNA
ncbi:hypothetical protein NHP190012_04650 [Helicobacter sp. NHP19-012]|uniref:Nickel/cobalt efflux system n=1 Tax=Helicobacter gastrofelis TaxID=2849642 RepID=A0ABN6I9N7_9HELI|nr:hypothetical protein NHP190012_04650 [Helicobacter sp. NHP19-012]GMB96234.1 hypothetical protein NHP22001_08230 [Helicobacter sp. NHP22-001]